MQSWFLFKEWTRSFFPASRVWQQRSCSVNHRTPPLFLQRLNQLPTTTTREGQKKTVIKDKMDEMTPQQPFG